MTTTDKKVFILLNSRRTIERFNQVTAMTETEVNNEYKSLRYGNE